MKAKMILFTLIVVLFLCVLMQRILIAQKKKRFSNNPLIKHLINEITRSMVDEILQSVASEKDLYKIVEKNVEVAEDHIISDSGSIFFRHEHMRLLNTKLDRNLMMHVIVSKVKKELRKHFPYDPTNGFKYKIKVGYSNRSNKMLNCAKAHIYYVVANEAYIHPKKW